jgi:AcrR family transcriptional regulator
MQNVQFALLSAVGATALFLGMLLFVELGRRYGRKQLAKHGEASRVGVGVVDSAVYGLLALLIGFAFSGAAGRFDKRREMVVHQVDAISTAWQRLDLITSAQQPQLQENLRRYVDALLTVYDHPAGSPDELRARALLDRAENEMWSLLVPVSLSQEEDKARMLVVPSINEMFDAVETERLAQRLHPPTLIYVMLVLAALAGALFAGFAVSKVEMNNWMYTFGFPATVAVALFVTLELESPRLGWIRIDGMDKALAELRQTMVDPRTTQR